MNTVTVHLRYLRMTPRKVRAIADLLKGLPLNEAEAQLALQRRRSAKPLLKLLRSAAASAKDRKFALERLAVEGVRVDQGPMLKRILPRARGSATPIQKKMSHVTLTLVEREKLAAPRFTINAPKKHKAPLSPKPGKKEHRHEEETKSSAREHERPAFWKRMFRRKSV